MAIINKRIAVKIWRRFFRDNKVQAKSNAALPSTRDLAPIFQVFEDNWIASMPAAKVKIDAILKRDIPLSYIRSLGKQWLQYRGNL